MSNITEAYKGIREGKSEAKTLKKMLGMIKALMKEIDNLDKGEDGADLHDQIISMDKSAGALRDTILKAAKVNPK
jgi:hypothetical protein